MSVWNATWWDFLCHQPWENMFLGEGPPSTVWCCCPLHSFLSPCAVSKPHGSPSMYRASKQWNTPCQTCQNSSFYVLSIDSGYRRASSTEDILPEGSRSAGQAGGVGIRKQTQSDLTNRSRLALLTSVGWGCLLPWLLEENEWGRTSIPIPRGQMSVQQLLFYGFLIRLRQIRLQVVFRGLVGHLSFPRWLLKFRARQLSWQLQWSRHQSLADSQDPESPCWYSTWRALDYAQNLLPSPHSSCGRGSPSACITISKLAKMLVLPGKYWKSGPPIPGLLLVPSKNGGLMYPALLLH